MNKIIFKFVILTAIVSFYGCNTMKGIGNDVQAVGGWITGGSEHVEESIKNNPPGSGMEK